MNAFGFAGINAHAVLEEYSPSADGERPGALTDLGLRGDLALRPGSR